MKMILIGILSGIVTGIGLGGGSILILILTLLFEVEQRTAQGANLIFFIMTAISSLIIHFKNGYVDKKSGKKLLFPIIAGAGCGAFATQIINPIYSKKVFGGFLLLVALFGIMQQLKRIQKEK